MLTNSCRSPDSRTWSALSRINVTFSYCCLLQLRSQSLGFSGGWEWLLLQIRVIVVVMSLRDAWDRSEQYKTFLLYSALVSSWATLLATVVFPKPGPPVKDTIETVPLWIACMARLISSERPNTWWISSGRQLGSSRVTRGAEICCWLLEISSFNCLRSCSKFFILGSNSSFHFLTSSSIRRCVPWSMSSAFRRFISSWSSPKATKEWEIVFHLSSNSSLGTPVEILWHRLFRKHLIRTISASRLWSVSAGMSCHPVAGSIKVGQISRSSKCRRVISNVFKSGRPPDGGNSFSHWLSYNLRLLFKLVRFAMLLFNIICSVEGGCMKDSKTFLSACVPPSTSSRANFVPLVFSSDGPKIDAIYKHCWGK